MKILNKDEAAAVYSAMTSLNNVGGRLRTTLRSRKRVHETCNGWILVENSSDPQEKFRNQIEFAQFYDI